MLGTDTLKLFAAMLLVMVPMILAGRLLTGRDIAGHRLSRPAAQAVGAIAGLLAGVGFLLAAG